MDGLEPIGWSLVVLGAIIVVIGLVFVFGDRIPVLGHLPGDIVIRGENLTVFIPLGTMFVVSVVVSLVLALLNRR